VLLFVCAGVPSCYAAWGLGVDYPTGRSQTRAGGDVMMDVGLVFDYRRVVRVAYARSFQMPFARHGQGLLGIVRAGGTHEP
jgi:hypothetical protein